MSIILSIIKKIYFLKDAINISAVLGFQRIKKVNMTFGTGLVNDLVLHL